MRDGTVSPGGFADPPGVATLPRPAYDLLNMEQYYRLDSPWHFPKSPRTVQSITQRGCLTDACTSEWLSRGSSPQL